MTRFTLTTPALKGEFLSLAFAGFLPAARLEALIDWLEGAK